MQQLLDVKKIGQEVLTELEAFNKKTWDAVSFRLIHGTLLGEKEQQESYKNVQEYKKERWEKALLKTNGNKRKAYELISSENFV